MEQHVAPGSTWRWTPCSKPCGRRASDLEQPMCRQPYPFPPREPSRTTSGLGILPLTQGASCEPKARTGGWLLVTQGQLDAGPWEKRVPSRASRF